MQLDRIWANNDIQRRNFEVTTKQMENVESVMKEVVRTTNEDLKLLGNRVSENNKNLSTKLTD